MTLYEIDSQIKEFIDNMFDSVDENGELIDIDPSVLEQLQADRKTKLENIALYIKNLEADANAIEVEEKKLKERRQSAIKKAERLKTLMTNSMMNAGEDKLVTARCAVSFRRSEAVTIIDEDALDAKFVKFETRYVPDKVKLKEALKAGEQIIGAVLEERQNIQIK